VLFRGIEDAVTVLERGRHWLLAEDMTAHFQAAHRDIGMERVGGDHTDGVELFLFDHLTEVGISFDTVL